VQRKTEHTLAKVQMGSRFLRHVQGNTKLKAVLKMSAQAGQSSAMNKTSVDAKVQDDDFQDVKRHKRHISNDTSQTTKESTKQVPTSTAVKLPSKSVLTRNFFAPLRTTDMDMKQEAPKRSGRPTP
jgi:hypothetical protein